MTLHYPAVINDQDLLDAVERVRNAGEALGIPVAFLKLRKMNTDSDTSGHTVWYLESIQNDPIFLRYKGAEPEPHLELGHNRRQAYLTLEGLAQGMEMAKASLPTEEEIDLIFPDSSTDPDPLENGEAGADQVRRPGFTSNEEKAPTDWHRVLRVGGEILAWTVVLILAILFVIYVLAQS